MVKAGRAFSAVRTFTQQDFDQFATISGDNNPIHVDSAYAASTPFGKPVAHGMMLYAAVCALLGNHFPGAIQCEQRLMFPAPTFAGEEMTIRAKIVSIEGNELKLATTITNPSGALTCDGETLLRWEVL